MFKENFLKRQQLWNFRQNFVIFTQEWYTCRTQSFLIFKAYIDMNCNLLGLCLGVSQCEYTMLFVQQDEARKGNIIIDPRTTLKLCRHADGNISTHSCRWWPILQDARFSIQKKLQRHCWGSWTELIQHCSLWKHSFIDTFHLCYSKLTLPFFRDKYIQYTDVWRKHALCKLGGFLYILGAEMSVFTLTLIAADRMYAVVRPVLRRLQ